MKTPYSFQEQAVESIAEQHTLVLDECGLGKTATAIWGAQRLEPGPKLVICPKSIKGQWAKELEELDPSTPTYQLGVAGRTPEDFEWDFVQYEHNIWVITHYETLLKIGPTLANLDWRALVLDEGHRIKNRKAKRTLWAKRLKAERKIVLTGSPMEKNIGDLWSLLNFLDRKTWSSYWRFLNQYAVVEVHPYFGFKEITGTKNLEELANEIGHFTFRRTKEEVAPDLPPKIEQVIPLPLQGNQKKLYDSIAAKKDIEVDLREVARTTNSPDGIDYIIIKNALAHIIKLQQVTSDPRSQFGYNFDGIKIEWVRDYTQDNPDIPMVVFTRFRKTAERLASIIDATLLVGGMKRPTVAIAPWLIGKTRLLVGTIDAMGEGLDLPRASVSIFLDQHWSSTKMTQAVDRVHRIGITEPKHILYLQVEDTTDHLVMEALEHKWSEQELVYHFIQAYGP